jgi:hypothetical protein
MIVPWSAIAWGLAFGTVAAIATWYRLRWAGVWCGLALIAVGWTYTARVRAEMPPNYYPLVEHMAGWLVMAVGVCLAIIWPGIVWLLRRGPAVPRQLTDEAADYADEPGPPLGRPGHDAEPDVAPDRSEQNR